MQPPRVLQIEAGLLSEVLPKLHAVHKLKTVYVPTQSNFDNYRPTHKTSMLLHLTLGPGSPVEDCDSDLAPLWGTNVGAIRRLFGCVPSSFSLSLAAPGSRLPSTVPLTDEAALWWPSC